jgi:hypothetical protein
MAIHSYLDRGTDEGVVVNDENPHWGRLAPVKCAGAGYWSTKFNLSASLPQGNL